jgi:glyoxylate utilization-related uncharacterized protein
MIESEDLIRGAFPLFQDSRGRLGVIEFTKELPFQPLRLFWISDVVVGETRANHGHRVCEQVIFVQRGTVRGFTINSNGKRFEFFLATGNWIYIPHHHWLQLNTFSEKSVVGVLASHLYDPDDYFDDPPSVTD